MAKSKSSNVYDIWFIRNVKSEFPDIYERLKAFAEKSGRCIGDIITNSFNPTTGKISNSKKTNNDGGNC